MSTSSYVYGLSNSCNTLIQSAQNCSTQMQQAIRGRDTYWTGLGSEELEGRIYTWIQSMQQLQSNLTSIQSSLSSYADRLYQQEQAAIAAAERAAAERAAAERTAAEKATAASRNYRY
ncbi:hypothetical protein ACFP56_14870 [Paenibacillus septentrionalis]|uniref:WXG100 family type VII secretion target n=1 Tax=Paenibacillus septentrionalis TaxID=429342 RepID=A0ABW1V8J7_9BACL